MWSRIKSRLKIIYASPLVVRNKEKCIFFAQPHLISAVEADRLDVVGHVGGYTLGHCDDGDVLVLKMIEF